MNKLRAMTAFRRVAELGATLLIRSTRHVALSEIGQEYLPRVQAILDEIDEAEAAARGLQGTPHGRLHVNAPATFGLLHVAPCVPAFAERYPGLVLDLSFNDRVVDLIEEQVHVALRIGTGLPDSSLLARALMPIERVVCAAPAYLARHGTPAVSGNITADSPIALREAALAGAGILFAPRFVVAPDIQSGRLVPLLPGHPPEAHTLYAVFPPGARPSTKVRLFLDHLMDCLGDPPGWESGA